MKLDIGDLEIAFDAPPEARPALAVLGVRAGRASRPRARVHVETVARLPPASGDRAPAFFLGAGRAFTSGDAHEIDAPCARAHVDTGRVQLWALPEAWRETGVTARTTMVVAIAATLARQAIFHVHGALVTDDAGAGALIVGPSGAGKSTAAALLHEGGLTLLGDDVAFVETAPNGRVVARAMPKRIHLDARFSQLTRLRALEWTTLSEERDRLEAALPARGARAVAIDRVIAIEPLHPARSSARRTSAHDLVGDVLESSALAACAGVGDPAAHLATLGALAAHATGWRLVTGQDAASAPQVLRRALEWP